MSTPSDMGQRLDEATAVELTGKIMIVAIIALFIVVVFIFLLHLYSRWFWYRHTATRAAARRRVHQEITALRNGLEPSVLKSIPVITFAQPDFENGLECTVCLSDVTDGEKCRLLPKCNHGFHVECIDMWFQSHSTCPICRNSISQQSTDTLPQSTESSPNEDYSAESINIPTNVLFWGNETQVSNLRSEDNMGPATSSSTSISSSTNSRQEGDLVIDIPSIINEEEDQKSPMPSRMRSLKRLLSRDRRSNPSSPRNVS